METLKVRRTKLVINRPFCLSVSTKRSYRLIFFFSLSGRRIKNFLKHPSLHIAHLPGSDCFFLGSPKSLIFLSFFEDGFFWTLFELSTYPLFFQNRNKKSNKLIFELGWQEFCFLFTQFEVVKRVPDDILLRFFGRAAWVPLLPCVF